MAPGQIVLGSDSHATTYGAVGAFGTGMGPRDMALALASGRTWLRVPETIRVQVARALPPRVGAKDLSLYLCGLLGLDGANYQAVEFHGVDWLDLDSRDHPLLHDHRAGRQGGHGAAHGRGARGVTACRDWLRCAATGASYVRTVEVDLDALPPQVAVPPEVDHVRRPASWATCAVDLVFIGTCTNGRLEDLRAAARILRGQARRRRACACWSSRPRTASCRHAVADGTLATLLEAGRHAGHAGLRAVHRPAHGRHRRGRGLPSPPPTATSAGAWARPRS